MINSFQDIDLNLQQSIIVRKYFSQKRMNQMWKYIDSLNLKLPTDCETEVICGSKNVYIRTWKLN